MTTPLPGTDSLGALTVFVSDLGIEADFCKTVLGLQVVFEDEQSVLCALGATALNLLLAAHADELVTPASSQPLSPVAQMMLTLWVPDTDAVCALLQQRGVGLLNGPIDRSWGKRTAAFVSPGGLVWELAQDI